MTRCGRYVVSTLRVYCCNSDRYLNVYRSGRVFLSGRTESTTSLAKLGSRDRGHDRCLEQDYSAICRPREQESCSAEARIFLPSAKAKARLVAGCPSGKYLTGVCATVFFSRRMSSRGIGGAKEQAQRDGQAEIIEDHKCRAWCS